jgi:spore coat polysaccharide biosynthesis protein SpsF
MRSATGVVLQARLASCRLPRKALAIVRGRTILEHCLVRLRAADVGPVILATTDRGEDDELADRADRLDVPVFRGSAEDVLDRFARCASVHGLDHVIRATADNPCVDIAAAERVLALLQDNRADYAGEQRLPYGGGVEAVTADALYRAAARAADPYDREHVTTFVKRRIDLFRVVMADAPAAIARPDVRLTVDTREDLEGVRALYLETRSEMPSIGDFVQAWDRARERSVA